MKTNKANSIIVLVDNCRGRYAWQSLATNYPIGGLTEADIAILKAGPDAQGHDAIVDDAMFHGVTVSIGEAVYRVETNDNGDLLGIPSHWELDDETGEWGEPESETLRRFTLPSHWACPVMYGDYSGLSDEEEREIDAFLAKEGIANWTLSDVSEHHWFSHRNDAGTLAGDVSRYTFVLIR
jgi:hypothetical protein